MHKSKIQRSITAMATAAAISLPLMSVAQAHGQEQSVSHTAIYNTVQNPSTPQYVINPFGARRLGAEHGTLSAKHGVDLTSVTGPRPGSASGRSAISTPASWTSFAKNSGLTCTPSPPFLTGFRCRYRLNQAAESNATHAPARKGTGNPFGAPGRLSRSWISAPTTNVASTPRRAAQPGPRSAKCAGLNPGSIGCVRGAE